MEEKEGAESEAVEEDELMKAIRAMSDEDRIKELYKFQHVWNSMDDESKYLLSGLGSVCSVILRNYSRTMGVLLKVTLEPKSFRIGAQERVYEPRIEGYVLETKEKTVAMSNVLGYEIDIKIEPEEVV